MSNKILNRMAEELKADGWTPDTRSAIEIIESEIEENKKAHRAQDLFDKLVKERRMAEAKKVAWLMWFQHGIAQDGLFDN